jgi:hypothetical protein
VDVLQAPEHLVEEKLVVFCCEVIVGFDNLCRCHDTLCFHVEYVQIQHNGKSHMSHLMQVCLHELKHNKYVFEVPRIWRQHDVLDLNDVCTQPDGFIKVQKGSPQHPQTLSVQKTQLQGTQNIEAARSTAASTENALPG